MANLTKEYFEEYLDKRLKDQTKDLKVSIKESQEELARMTSKGFEDVLKRLDVREQVERHDRILKKVTEALNIRM